MQKKSFDRIGESLFFSELPNGLHVQVIPKPGFAVSFAAFATNYGGAHRRFSVDGVMQDTPAGVAHYLEHKMFDLPDGDNALALLSANGADPNAFTSSGMTAYYFQSTAHFEENLRLLLHFVSTPYFTAETVQKERGIIGQEIRMGEDDPGIALYYGLLRMLYARHPIRDRVAGTVESIAQITEQTLYDCHRIFYAPSNMALCVAGDVDPERIAAIAEELLPVERAPIPKADFGEAEDLLPLRQRLHLQMPVSAPQFLIGTKLKAESDGPAALRQRLVSTLALRTLVGSSSPFYTGLYGKGLLNRDYDYEADFTAGTGTVILGGESPDPEAVFAALQEAVAEVARSGLDRDRFSRAKRASLGARLRGLEDFDSLCIANAAGVFNGYCALDALSVLETIGQGECEAFLADALAPERLALAVMDAKGGS